MRSMSIDRIDRIDRVQGSRREGARAATDTRVMHTMSSTTTTAMAMGAARAPARVVRVCVRVRDRVAVGLIVMMCAQG